MYTSQASQGFRYLEQLARQRSALLPDEQSVKVTTCDQLHLDNAVLALAHCQLQVLLVNPTQKLVTGGGKTVTFREHVKRRKEADIVIDCRTPMIQKILRWAASVEVMIMR